MTEQIENSRIKGTVLAPPSKSYTIRALAAAVLCPEESVIANYSVCEDALAAVGIVENLGGKITYLENKIHVLGGNNLQNPVLNCCESALCLRLFTPIAGNFSEEITIIAEKTLTKRKTEGIKEIFNMLGAVGHTDSGKPPFVVRGPFKGGRIKVDGSQSSQLISGLLFSLPLAKSDSIIEINELKSRPYIDMTLEILQQAGIEIVNEDYKLFRINGGQKYSPLNINLEGDWSGAAAFLVSAALAGEISVSGLNLNSLQGDKIILDILRITGAKVEVSKHQIHVATNKLNAFEYSADETPDIVPLLAVLGCFCEGTSVISGIARLANKESSRADIITREINSLGGDIEIRGDSMFIKQSVLHGGEADSHGDHRIAMALAVAGLVSNGNVVIKNAECVSKSYPDFWKDFL